MKNYTFAFPHLFALTLAALFTSGCSVKFKNIATLEQSEQQMDVLPPSIQSVVVAAGTYASGENLDITVTFSEDVTITGTPRIALDVGGTTRYADYVPGAPGGTHVFRWVVTALDVDANGIEIQSPLDLNGGSIVDGANWPLTAAFIPPATPTVTVDAVAPTITGITLPANGTYTLGQNLDFTMNFDKSMTVSGTRLVLTVGSTTRYADYLSGSGTAAIVYRYTVPGADFDTNGISLAAAIDLNSGTLTDAAGNAPASLNHGAGSTAGILVETYGILSGATSIDLRVNLEETGDVHYAIYNADPGVMTASAVRSAAVGALGGSLVANGSAAITTANSNLTELITSLPDATTYYVRVIPEGSTLGLFPDTSVRSFTAVLPDKLARVDVTSVTFNAGQEIRYGVYRPEAYYKESSNTYPTIIALQGWGEVASSSGADTDAAFETTMRTSSGLLREIEDGDIVDLPFIVLQPKCPNYGGTNCWNWAGATGMIDELFEHAKANMRIDLTRVYITGLSTGGAGAVNYAKAYPAKIAAVAPIAMVSETISCGSLAALPFWFFHNINDTTQNSNNSVTARNDLVACPSVVAPKLTRYTDCVSGSCHNSWTKTYTMVGGTVQAGDDAFGNVFDWFLTHTK